MRTRLIVTLAAGLALVWITVTAFTVVEAGHEIGEVLDARLAQGASLLAMRIGDEWDEIDSAHTSVPHRYAKPLSFQVWKGGTRLRLHTTDAPDTRFSAKDSGFSTESIGGRDWRVFSLWDPKGEYLVQVREAAKERRHLILEVVAAMAKPLAVALPLLALLAWVATGRAFRPLARVSEEISRRDPTFLDALESDVPREVAPLVGRINALLARVRSSLDSERRFTSDAAHELRTPLAALRAQLQVAQGATDETQRKRAVAQALAAGERATHVVEQLLTLARLEQGAWKTAAAPFDLRHLASGALADRASQAGAKGIELGLEGTEPVRCMGHEGLIAIAVGNLLDNAIRHSPPGTAVTIAVATEGGRAAIRVRDQGPGIPAARREEALRRFARLEASDSDGSGLGLSIVSRIAELHGASFVLIEGPGGRGLEAALTLAAS